MFMGTQMARLAKLLERGRTPFVLVSSPRATYRTRPRAMLAVDRLLRGADDLLVAESSATARFFIEGLGYDPSRVGVILNGVEPPAGERDPSARERPRGNLGLAEGDFLAGSIGRLHEMKGHAILLRALARLPARFKAVFLGDGEERARLERGIRELGLEGRARLMGEVPDARGWMAALDLLVHPAIWEGTPNVILEAMAEGVPVLASRVDGIEDVVEDGSTGRLVAPGDPEALARAIEALALDPALRAALADRAGKAVRERFTFGRMVGEYHQAYDAAFGRAR